MKPDPVNTGESACVLIGHPRSGTTFLHRFLLENYQGLTGTTLEDMVFMRTPGVLKGVLKPVARALPLSVIYRPEIHSTGMREWEADDIAFSIHCRAGWLFWLYSQCRKTESFEARDFSDWVTQKQESVLSCWNDLHSGDLGINEGGGILSKSFVMLFYLKEFLGHHPSAKAIIVSRSPTEVIPSVLSLLDSVQRRLIPSRGLTPMAVENVLHSVRLYYEQLFNVLSDDAIMSRCIHLRYEDLGSPFGETCERLSGFLPFGQWRPGAVVTGAARQATHRSRHQYRAEDFGLNLKEILDEIPCP